MVITNFYSSIEILNTFEALKLETYKYGATLSWSFFFFFFFVYLRSRDEWMCLYDVVLFIYGELKHAEELITVLISRFHFVLIFNNCECLFCNNATSNLMISKMIWNIII